MRADAPSAGPVV